MESTLIEVPSFTKNKAGHPHPKMYQTKVDNQWYHCYA